MSPQPPSPDLQDLAQDERSFRAVADYTYDWESWHGPDGRPLWLNRAVERITGYQPKERITSKLLPHLS